MHGAHTPLSHDRSRPDHDCPPPTHAALCAQTTTARRPSTARRPQPTQAEPRAPRPFCARSGYCFVCDAPASTCPRWDQHCMATHSSPHWASQRQQWRLYKGAPPPPPPAAAAASSSTSGVPDDNHIAKKVSRWSCDELLAAIQQVYPVEAPEPPGFEPSKTLRPYQKQSLAFMVASEQSTDKATAGHNEVTNLPVRGGWLCDEMGMGKTAVCASLVLANPSKAKPVSDAEFKNLLNDGAPCHKYKATLIIVNNTLVQYKRRGSNSRDAATMSSGALCIAPSHLRADTPVTPTAAQAMEGRHPQVCAERRDLHVLQHARKPRQGAEEPSHGRHHSDDAAHALPPRVRRQRALPPRCARRGAPPRRLGWRRLQYEAPRVEQVQDGQHVARDGHALLQQPQLPAVSAGSSPWHDAHQRDLGRPAASQLDGWPARRRGLAQGRRPAVSSAVSHGRRPARSSVR